MKILTTTTYQSKDGFYEFKTQKECEEYEHMLDDIKYFRVAYHPNLKTDGHYERMWYFGVNIKDMQEAYNVVFGYMLKTMIDYDYINPYNDTFIPYFVVNECSRNQFFNTTEDNNISKIALVDKNIKDTTLPFPNINYEYVSEIFKKCDKILAKEISRLTKYRTILKEYGDIRVLLSDRKTIIKLSEFDSLTMKVIGVEVTNGKFVTLKHTRDDNNNKFIDWYNSNKNIDIDNGEYLPTCNELKSWYDNRKLIDAVLIEIGGEPMEMNYFYWSSEEKFSTVAWGLYTRNGERGWFGKDSDGYCYRCRAFIYPKKFNKAFSNH